MDEVVSTIANLGFPIAISIFLLVRIETKLEELSKSIEKLTNAIVSIE